MCGVLPREILFSPVSFLHYYGRNVASFAMQGARCKVSKWKQELQRFSTGKVVGTKWDQVNPVLLICIQIRLLLVMTKNDNFYTLSFFKERKKMVHVHLSEYNILGLCTRLVILCMAVEISGRDFLYTVSSHTQFFSFTFSPNRKHTRPWPPI